MFSRAISSAVLCCAALAGCAADQTRPTDDPASVVPAETQAAPPAAFASPLEETFYRALVGEIAGFSGDYTLSAESFYLAAQQTGNPELARRAAEVALLNRDSPQALRAARLWQSLAPTDPDAQQVLVAVLLRNGETEEALSQLDRLLSQAPKLSDQRLEMLLKLLRPREDKQAALQIMGRIADKRRNDPAVLMMYARLLQNTREHERALAVLDQVLALEPDNAEAVPMYVDILHQQDKLDQALAWLGGQVARQPHQDVWREIYARLLISADRHDEAIQQFRLLLKKSPDNPDALYALGLLSLQAKRPAAARHYFLRLLDTDSEERDAARYFLGQIAEERNELKDAVEWYRQVGRGAHYLNAQARAALLLVDQGKVEQGLQHLQGIKANTAREMLSLLLFEAEVLTKQKRYQEAMTLYERGLQNDPDNTDLLYSRGLLAERMDRLDIMERDLRRVMELEPDNVEAINALGYSLADRTERHEEAHVLIKQALEQKPDAFYIQDSMGWVLYRMGKHAEALEYLRKAYATQADPEVAAHLGEVLWVSGNQAEARKIWREAAKLFPNDEKLQGTMERFLK